MKETTGLTNDIPRDSPEEDKSDTMLHPNFLFEPPTKSGPLPVRAMPVPVASSIYTVGAITLPTTITVLPTAKSSLSHQQSVSPSGIQGKET